MLWKSIKMNLEDLWPFFAVEGAFFLVWVIVEAIILNTVKPDTSAAICGVILIAVAGMMCLFAGGTYPILNVDMLLRFGVTRRTALAATLATISLNTMCAMAFAALLGWVDGFIAQAWVDALPWVHSADTITIPLWGYFVTGCAVICLAFGMGALLHRFGRKAAWVAWGAWMLLVVGSQLVDLEAIFETPATIPALVALCVVSLIAGGGLILRTSVRN